MCSRCVCACESTHAWVLKRASVHARERERKRDEHWRFYRFVSNLWGVHTLGKNNVYARIHSVKRNVYARIYSR